MDFSLLIVVAVVASGAIALVDAAFLRRKRQAAAAGANAKDPAVVEYARSFFPILLIVLLFRSFLFEPFRIPSASMMPGLVDGDFILVNKFDYGLRLPVSNMKVAQIGEPHRGDVVVFRSPADLSINLIKRLVGLPGDRVTVRNNRVSINGVPVRLEPDGIYADGYGFTGSPLALEKFGNDAHHIMFAQDRFATDFEGTVPAGTYFFMGDNRNDSEDSRFPKVGFVPEKNLVGHAMRIWMNWQVPGWPRLARIGMPIR